MDGDQIRQWCHWPHLALGIPVEHDLDLDTKHTLLPEKVYRKISQWPKGCKQRAYTAVTGFVRHGTLQETENKQLTCLRRTCLTAESIYSLTGWPEDIMYPSLNFIDLARCARSFPLTITCDMTSDWVSKFSTCWQPQLQTIGKTIKKLKSEAYLASFCPTLHYKS